MGWCAARRETLLEGRQEEGHKVGGLLGNPNGRQQLAKAQAQPLLVMFFSNACLEQAKPCGGVGGCWA